MPPENKSFHSASGSWFWQPADAGTRETIKNKLIEDNKKGIRTGIFFILISVLVFIYGIFMQPESDSFFDMFEKVMYIGAPVLLIVFFGDSTISTARYLKKSKEDMFYCRHVVIVSKRMTTNGLTNWLVVEIRSDDDREDEATVDMEIYARNRLLEGQHGMFVMI